MRIHMYLLIGMLVIIVGAILLLTVEKIAKNNSGLVICIRIISVCLIVAGFVNLYLLLSGKLNFPLSAN